MKRIRPAWSAVALGTVAFTWLMVAPSFAQEGNPRTPAGPSGGSSGDRGGGGASSAPSGGGGGGSATAPSGGGGSNGGGGGGFGGGGSRSESGGGGRNGATGGSGYAVPRGERGGDRSGGRPSGTASAPGSGSGAVDRGAMNSGGGERSRGAVRGGDANAALPGGNGEGVPAYARPRDGKEPIGTAVPRGTVPTTGRRGGDGIFVPSGGYYGGYYDPWWYGAGYSGYYGGYYDPWYGGYPDMGYGGYGGYSQVGGGYSYADEGKLRLKINPRQAEVFVDGYFVGVVDDFDGLFQRLHLDTGAHRIEIRAAGYETLTFDVRITPDHTTTYQGEMKRIQ